VNGRTKDERKNWKLKKEKGEEKRSNAR